MIIIFTHIPKTGGNTLASVLFKQYDYNTEMYSVYLKDSLPENLNYEKLKCVIGHHPFGLHRSIPKDCKYITMLREPVDRVLSDYYFDLKFHNKKAADSPIEKFIETYANRQTRWIAGNDREDLELAKSNMKRYFIAVGLTEWFDESLFIMKRKLGWNDISYKKYNVNEKRSKTREVPQNVIDHIKLKNTLDLQLYRYAKKELMKEIDGLDSGAKDELLRYKNRLCKGSVSEYANPDDYV